VAAVIQQVGMAGECPIRVTQTPRAAAAFGTGRVKRSHAVVLLSGWGLAAKREVGAALAITPALRPAAPRAEVPRVAPRPGPQS
jgi:hypothetical protein